MTTSVFYPAVSGTTIALGDANGTAARSLARNLTTAATMSERVFASGSGSTTMTSGTLSATPSSGDVLIAVVARRADGQATITNPTGWVKLTGAGTAGSRLLEVWWYRSTGVVGDKGTFSWTVTSATGAWGIDLLRFGGNAAYGDPVVESAATAFTATTTPAAATATPNASTGETPGMLLTCIAVTGTSLGASGITGAFSGTGTAEATNHYYDSTYGGCATGVHDLYNNATSGSYGSAYTLGASRAGHQAVIQLTGGGNAVANSAALGAGVNYNAGAVNFPGGMFQSFATYDTSSLPDNNTISSATLGLRATASSVAGSYATTDPANATLQVRYYGTSITDTRGYNNNHWFLSPTGISAKTLVATYPAASAWTAGTDYTLTSTASFPGVINKTGNTVLVFTTDDYAGATARSSRETYGLDGSSTFAPLTVVHSFLGTATVAATLTTTPTISRAVTYARTLVASLTSTPAIARTIGYARTLSATLTSTPAIDRALAYTRTLAATITASPTINRAATYARTLTTSLTTSPIIQTTLVPFVAQVARVIRLGGRTTIQLVQTVTARLGGRSTIRAPKE